MRWSEKYRPKTLDEVIGQEDTIASIKSNVAKGSHPMYLFHGISGVGKTTVAHLTAQAIFGDDWKRRFIEFNASDARGIEDVRNKYKRLAASQGRRMVYLSEFDQMTTPAQNALRRPLELTKGAIFVFSANYPYNIIDAIKSRCSEYHFEPIKANPMMRHLLHICEMEGVKVDKRNPAIQSGFKVLAAQSRGDMRKAINTLEKIVSEGNEITVETVAMLRRPDMATEALKRALAGDLQGSKEMIEDVFIGSGFNPHDVADELYSSIPRSTTDRQVRARLYERLDFAVQGCTRLGVNPVIPFVSFISFAWRAPRMMKCPALEDQR